MKLNTGICMATESFVASVLTLVLSPSLFTSWNGSCWDNGQEQDSQMAIGVMFHLGTLKRNCIVLYPDKKLTQRARSATWKRNPVSNGCCFSVQMAEAFTDVYWLIEVGIKLGKAPLMLFYIISQNSSRAQKMP